MNIIDQLKKWRKQNGLSQSQAASQLSISVRTLQDWEQGRHTPSGLAARGLQALLTSKKTIPAPSARRKSRL